MNMQRLKLLFSLLLCALSVNTQAQDAGLDVIHLNSGQVHKGIIIEQKPGSHLTILRLPQRDTLQFSYTDVNKLTKEVTYNQVSEEEQEMVEEGSNSKRILTQLHYYTGGGDYSLGGLGATLSKQIREDWLLGGGVYYIGQVNSRPFIQQQSVVMAADFKWCYAKSRNKKRMGYLSLAAGYYFPLNKDFYLESFNANVTTSRTYYLNPSLAFHWDIYKSVGLMIDFGYQLTTASYSSQSSGEILQNRNFNNVAIRGTLIF